MKTLLIIFLGAIVILFLGINKPEKKSLPYILILLLAALSMIPFDWYDAMTGNMAKWQTKYVSIKMLFWDIPALAFSAVLIIASMLVFILFSNQSRKGADLPGLMLFSLCGGLMMTSFTNLVMLFLGIEALSIPLYVLAGSRKTDLRSNEAGLKYFLMGAFSTAIFLLGCAFVYGGTGSLDIISIGRSAGMMGHIGVKSALLHSGIIILLASMLFKVAAFPFHFWSPDVYDGSPNRTTVFMATVVKIAAFAAFFRLFQYAFSDIKGWWSQSMAIAAAATILVGNIAAVRQKSFKRTLAYSSIAHAGYMLMAVLSAPEDGFWALLIYTLAYAASAVAVFYLLDRYGKESEGYSFESFGESGAGNRFASLVLIVSMFSMAGIPLTAGFAGKFMLFSSAFAQYNWLVGIALLGSAISIAYYFRIFKEVLFKPTAGLSAYKITWGEYAGLALALVLTLSIGLWPALITGIQTMVVK